MDELSAIALLSRYLADKHLDDPVVVAADLGAAKRARNFASRLDASLAFIEKRRSSRNDATSEALNIIGDVENRTAIVFDDEIDTAGTVTQAAQLLQGAGVLDILVCCVHGVFSDPAIERLKDSAITEIVTTDTVPPASREESGQAHRSIGCPIACPGNRTHPRGRLGRRIVHVAARLHCRRENNPLRRRFPRIPSGAVRPLPAGVSPNRHTDTRNQIHGGCGVSTIRILANNHTCQLSNA